MPTSNNQNKNISNNKHQWFSTNINTPNQQQRTISLFFSFFRSFSSSATIALSFSGISPQCLHHALQPHTDTHTDTHRDTQRHKHRHTATDTNTGTDRHGHVVGCGRCQGSEGSHNSHVSVQHQQQQRRRSDKERLREAVIACTAWEKTSKQYQHFSPSAAVAQRSTQGH